jgi:hypothetical protein
MTKPRTALARTLKRVARVRAGIFSAIVLLVVLAFVLHLGLLSFLMRGILVVGIAALAASYVWELLVKWRRRSE